jgi:ribosomal protein L22
MAEEGRKTESKGAGDKPPVKKTEAKAKATAEKESTPKRAARKPAAKKATAAKSGSKAPAKKATAKPKAAPKAKPAAEKAKLPPPIVRASAKYVRVAPRKARLVADQVRGLQIDKARALLQFSPRSAAQDIAKVLDSAASNAENNHELIADDMKVMEITVDEGPTLRRWRPRALGRATRINKRTSHISIALTPEEES